MSEEEQMSLDDILDGEEATETTEVVEATSEAEAENPTGEEDAAPPVADKEEKEERPSGYVPQAALADERGKRQDLQRQLDELRGAFQQTQVKPPETPQEEVDFLDDPDKWIAQREQKILAQVNEVKHSQDMRFLNLCEAAAKTRHEDYDEVVQHFAQAAQGNVALQQEAAAASDPAEFVYQTGKRLAMLNGAGGDLEALIRQREEAAIARYLEENPSAASKAASVPSSLSTVTGASQRPSAFTPPSAEELFD